MDKKNSDENKTAHKNRARKIMKQSEYDLYLDHEENKEFYESINTHLRHKCRKK